MAAAVTVPDPPRRVRLRTAAATWWPLGVATGTLWAILTVLFLVMLAWDGFRMPMGDWALDRDGTAAAAPAQVTAVAATSTRYFSRRVHRVHYRFVRDDGTPVDERCYTLGSRYRPGQSAAMEYLPDAPHLRRLRDSMRAESALWHPLFLAIWLPVSLLLAFWGSRVYRTLVLLRNGRAAPAELVQARPTRLISSPPHLRVHYAFVDGQGGHREGWQLVRRAGVLGQRIADLAPGTPIPGSAAVHDEANPAVSRLCAGEDVEPER